MSLERHMWGVDTDMDAYVWHYRKWLDRELSKIPSFPALRVLDIACGDGSPIAMHLAVRSDVSLIVGIDRYKGPWSEHSKVVYITGDACAFQAPEQFNLITSFEFVEHIPHYELLTFLENMKGSLEDGGYFMGTTPIGSMGKPSGNPYHVQEYSMEELRTILSHFFSKAEVSDIGRNMQGFVCQK